MERRSYWERGVRFKVFAPGGTVYSATASELQDGSSDPSSAKYVKEFYKIAIPADWVARAVLYAIEQPADVEIDKVVLGPTVQDF
jgi:NADP-dependent 3-hydroxy acid dehydrogenase YdfG